MGVKVLLDTLQTSLLSNMKINQLFNVKELSVLITGSNGNIGSYLVKILLQNNASVFGLDMQKEAKILHKNFTYFQCDITNKNKLINIKNKILKKNKAITVLINNAAIDAPPDVSSKNSGNLESYSEVEFDHYINTNLKGTFLVSQIFGSEMAKNKNGSIINISSIYGMLSPDQSIYEYKNANGREFFKPAGYSISKGSIYNMTRYMAEYWAKKNVRVNTLTLSGIFNNQDKDFIKNYTNRIPMGRMGSLDDIIGPIVFLSTSASKYMTGSNLVVDGGWTII